MIIFKENIFVTFFFVKLIYIFDVCTGPFLHGELEVDIQEARDLPDTDNFLFNIKNCFGQEKDVTDPYVAVCLDNTRIITTSVCIDLSSKIDEVF